MNRDRESQRILGREDPVGLNVERREMRIAWVVAEKKIHFKEKEIKRI